MKPSRGAAIVAKARDNPGKQLRSLRLALGLTLRDVQRESLLLATKLRRREFIIHPPRLYDIETKNIVPGVHKLYTLAHVYQCGLDELLRWYGIPRR